MKNGTDSLGYKSNSVSWTLVFFALLGGYSIPLVGVLYTADLLIFIGVLWGFFGFLKLHNWHKVGGVFLILLSLCIACFLLDLVNQVPFGDYMRGVSRNLIFLMAMFVGYFFSERNRPETVLLIICLSSISYAVTVYLGIGVPAMTEGHSLSTFFKYYGLIYLAILCFLISRFSLTIAFVLTLSLAGVVLLLADFRSGAILMLMPLGFIFIRGFSGKARKNVRLVFLVCGIIVACFAQAMLALLVDENFFEREVVYRRQLSNDLRMEMVSYAYDRILERPLAGYGSWSNANDFVSALQPDSQATVHSFFLQYGYEYGVVGFIMVLFLFIISIVAFFKLIDPLLLLSRKYRGVWLGVVFCWGLFVYNLFMGGLGGYGRITQGLTAGILLFFAMSPLARIVFVEPVLERKIKD